MTAFLVKILTFQLLHTNETAYLHSTIYCPGIPNKEYSTPAQIKITKLRIIIQTGGISVCRVFLQNKITEELS